MKKFLLLLILTTIALPQTPYQLLQEKNKEKWEKKAQEKALSKDYLSTTVYQPELKPNWNQDIQQFVYEEVVSENLDSILKEKIFEALLDWIILNFDSKNNIIEIKDRDLGRIVARGELKSFVMEGRFGLLSVSNMKEYTYPFTIDIKIRDNRFKYVINIKSFKVATEMLSIGLGDVNTSDLGEYGYPFTNANFNQAAVNDKMVGFDFYKDVDTAVKLLVDQMKANLKNYDFNEEDW